MLPILKQLLLACLGLLPVIFLSACTKNSDIPIASPIPTNSTPIEKAKLNMLLDQKPLFVFVKEGQLWISHPETRQTGSLYVFKDGEQPIATYLQTFSVSPDNHWIAWYTPQQGIMVLDTYERSVKSIYPPNDFLNTNAYLEFNRFDNKLYFITDKGNTLIGINPDNEQQEQTEIPYPYGNLFHWSPDGKTILFISGYGQSDSGKPQFMLTDAQGEFQKQFTTDTELSMRHWTTWGPQSDGVVMVKGGELWWYPATNPEQKELIFKLKDGAKMSEIHRIEDQFFILSDQDYWHVFSFKDRKEVARTPLTLMGDLHKPTLLPWTPESFLIEEIIEVGKQQFKRLWISNFRGQKQVVIAKYHEVIFDTKLNPLE